ncbi:MAG TPA: hypothetical protein VG939_18005 [Caulobacteraceae bacterium]|nr:hypothetical protein [Caulobacteraceae bacterium]
MIPLFLTVRVRAAGARDVNVWLPLFLIWILLAPLLILVIPVVFVAAAIFETNPFAAVAGVIAVFCALSGTHVEVSAPDAEVLVDIT